MAEQAYCVKCKSKRVMKDAKKVDMPNAKRKGQKALKGTCSNCGTGMFKILPKE